MSRLIDADELIEILEENNQKLQEQIKGERVEVQKVVYGAQAFSTMEMIRVIKEQPTAFDVDKVVGKFENLKKIAQIMRNIDIEHNAYIEEAYERGRIYVLNEALEIVKEVGGIDDNN